MSYLVGLLALAVALAGCGGGDDTNSNADRFEGDEAEVVEVIDDFGSAGRDGDGAQICEDIFAPALAKNVERESNQSCQSEVEENLPEGEYELTVDDVNVKGDVATVSITDQEDNKSVLHMVKTENEWRVLRVTGAE